MEGEELRCGGGKIMASFGSTKCARNSVSRAKSCDACVEGVKICTFFEKIASV